MRILLDEEESQKWLDILDREKTLEETSRFPANMKLPEGCELQPTALTQEIRKEIYRLHDTGHKSREIAPLVGISEARIRGLVGIYNRKKASVEPKVEGLQPMQPLVMPTAEKPAKTTQDRIDGIIAIGTAKGVNFSGIAAKINRETGQVWMPDDVSKRLAELRSHG
ncbi:hypothetical protein M0R72_15825 [Candidatus Pacearchaeota archaeon]|jgi:hypothetical protein|nr:hypothetical protein [Candidatus Pacearchaeota archaeon]